MASTFELLQVSAFPPTSKEIAGYAGVSLRLVFHHFGELDALYEAVAVRYGESANALGLDVDGALPLPTRIVQTVKKRSRLYTSFGNLRQNLAALTPSSPKLDAIMTSMRLESVGHLESTFAPELRSAGESRPMLLCALDIAVSWPTWERMRTVDLLAPKEARAVMVYILEATLGGRSVLHAVGPSPSGRTSKKRAKASSA